MQEINGAPENEIINIRTVEFPVDKVFNARKDEEHLKNWWGPKGFTNTFEVFDFIEGGNWKFVMHGPNGVNYPNEAKIIEIKENKKIIIDHISAPQFRIIVSFEDKNGNTKITFRQIFNSKEECESIKKFVGDANEENFDRLENELKRSNNQ